MPQLVQRADGGMVLETNADPAGAGHTRVGYRRYSVGLDVGGRGDDPSALCIIRAECLPFLTGRGFEQMLGQPHHTIVWTETIRLAEATDVIEWVVATLGKLDQKWTFAFDATGLGAPLGSMFDQAKVQNTPLTMTAGSSYRVDGGRLNVSKNMLLEQLATSIENGTLTIAHDLPYSEDLIREITAFEYQTTNAGNMTLRGGGKGHHSDRAIAAAIALFNELHGPGWQTFTTTKLTNYW